MVKTLKFSDESGEYTIKLDDNEIKLECYLLGSPTGGTGTECYHTIGSSKLSDFLKELNLKNQQELLVTLSTYQSNQWSEFHQIVMRNQTETFVWHETSWND